MKNFKKLLAVLLAGLMLLSLAACGGKKDDVVKSGVIESSGMYSINSEDNAHFPLRITPPVGLSPSLLYQLLPSQYDLSWFGSGDTTNGTYHQAEKRNHS